MRCMSEPQQAVSLDRRAFHQGLSRADGMVVDAFRSVHLAHPRTTALRRGFLRASAQTATASLPVLLWMLRD